MCPWRKIPAGSFKISAKPPTGHHTLRKRGVPELLFHACLFFSYICFSRFIVFNLLKEHSAENRQSLCYNVILKLVAI